ncbi:Hypoxia up-regulated protein 1, partial [Kappamyces sp. JEL0680]
GRPIKRERRASGGHVSSEVLQRSTPSLPLPDNEDGEIPDTPSGSPPSPLSKIQKPYLTWPKFQEPEEGKEMKDQPKKFTRNLSTPHMQFKLFVLTWLISLVTSTVIGIDFGTDWLKVSIIKPGGQIETVLNRESKRKTNAVLNIRNGIRTYGIEADTLGMRFPHLTYGHLKSLLGKKFTDPLVQHSNMSTTLIASKRGTVAFQHDETTVFELEELVAMLIKHCKAQAEAYSNIKVSGAVITVPPHFTQFERQAFLDAAEIAGVRVYALINDETAVAINYAVGKKFAQREYHVFYDMGAGTTVTTLVSFQSDKKKNAVELEIKGYATDPSLGGRQVDGRLQTHLAAEFSSMHKGKLSGDITQDARAMARLLKEANRVKTILSANQQVTASIENLKDGFDFKLVVTRKTLETLCKDLFDRTTLTIESVLSSSNISIADIKSLVLFGGGVRVPAIQKALGSYVGTQKIARNVDGDEAAAFGAVLHAAAVSSQFKLGQTNIIKDLTSRPVTVSYDSEQE